MYTLFISTFDKYIHIGLLKDDKLVDLIKKESLKSHSVYTMPAIKEILENNKITVKDLDQIEVINGPGSFTGVRIGVTIAKTLAYALNIPIKAITTLEAYAASLNITKNTIITMMDLKGVYYGNFDKNLNLIEPLNYLNKKEFDNYIKENNLEDLIYNEQLELDIEKIHERINKKESINPHHVNPLYIKKIEAEKW